MAAGFFLCPPGRTHSSRMTSGFLRLSPLTVLFPMRFPSLEGGDMAPPFLKFNYGLTVKNLRMAVQCRPSDRSVRLSDTYSLANILFVVARIFLIAASLKRHPLNKNTTWP